MGTTILTSLDEFRAGWPTLLAGIAGSATGVAVLTAYSLGALIHPLMAAFQWGRAEIAAAALFSTLGYLAGGPLAGWLADRDGARRVALASQLCLIAGLISMSRIDGHIWTLYAGSFLLALFAAGTLPIVWTQAITGWFVRRRGLALGLSLIGTGLVGGLLPSYVSALVLQGGWRAAFLGLAALPLCIGLPVSVLLFQERRGPAPGAEAGPAARGALPDRPDFRLGEALRTRGFWQMSLSFFLAATAVSAVLVHTIPLLMDRHVSAARAAAVLGLFGLAVSAGRLISGVLLDLLGGPIVAAVTFSLSALSCGVLVLAGTDLALCSAAIVFVGLSAGAESDIAAYMVARAFGRAHYGAIYGLLYALYCLGSGIGPLLAGRVYERTGSYGTALVVGMVGFVIAAALVWSVPDARPRRGLS